MTAEFTLVKHTIWRAPCLLLWRSQLEVSHWICHSYGLFENKIMYAWYGKFLNCFQINYKNVLKFHFKVIRIQSWWKSLEKYPPIWRRLNLNWFKIFNISLLSYFSACKLFAREENLISNLAQLGRKIADSFFIIFLNIKSVLLKKTTTLLNLQNVGEEGRETRGLWLLRVPVT